MALKPYLPRTRPSIRPRLSTDLNCARWKPRWRLPESQRAPLVLVTVAGLSQAEAAEALGLNIKSLEMRIARAREKLRSKLRV